MGRLWVGASGTIEKTLMNFSAIANRRKYDRAMPCNSTHASQNNVLPYYIAKVRQSVDI